VRSRLFATALWAVSGAVAVVAAIVVWLFHVMGGVNNVGGAIAIAVSVAGVLGFIAGVQLYRSNSQ
jgi:hypothetical protein